MDLDSMTREELSEFVTGLADTTRSTLLELLRDKDEGLTRALALDAIRTELSEEDFATARGVMFRTDNYDNGYFLDHYGARVMLADGEVERVDFSDTVNEHLTELYGTVAPDATLVVNLRTGTFDFESFDTGQTFAERLDS